MRRFIVFALVAVVPAIALADPQSNLAPGLYKVEASTGMPNIEGPVRRMEAEICLSEPPFPVLGVAGAFNGCAAVGVQAGADRLDYSLSCPERGGARGRARYRVSGTAFRGWVEITMGGKSMTMTEHQRGRRIGDCPAE